MIGALTIGQAPRQDLVAPLQKALPAVEFRQAGALDRLAFDELPNVRRGEYPLGTRLRDGTAVFVSEAFLLPHLQARLNELEEAGAVATVLLCAGTFAELRGKRPLFKPFDLAKETLRTLGLNRLSVHTPFAPQISPIVSRWAAANFDVDGWAAPFAPQDEAFLQQAHTMTAGKEVLVLDYVGHEETAVQELQQQLALPVLDLGQLLMRGITAVML